MENEKRNLDGILENISGQCRKTFFRRLFIEGHDPGYKRVRIFSNKFEANKKYLVEAMEVVVAELKKQKGLCGSRDAAYDFAINNGIIKEGINIFVKEKEYHLAGKLAEEAGLGKKAINFYEMAGDMSSVSFLAKKIGMTVKQKKYEDAEEAMCKFEREILY